MLLQHYISRFALASAALLMVCALLLTVLPASGAKASREVLSDLDCVVEPSDTARVGSAVPGVLQDVRYDRADFVSKGTVLAVLESGVERAALTLADRIAQYSTAIELRAHNAAFGKRTQERNSELYTRSSLSSQNMDQVTTEANIAALQLRQERENKELAKLEALRAKAALERRTVTSPFDGSITKRLKTIGEYVEGEPVFEIAKLDPLHVEVILPLEQLGTVSTGMLGNITLNVPGLTDEVLEARVRRIDSIADAASGTYGVRLELPNPDLMILAGVRCKVSFIAD